MHASLDIVMGEAGSRTPSLMPAFDDANNLKGPQGFEADTDWVVVVPFLICLCIGFGSLLYYALVKTNYDFPKLRALFFADTFK